MPSGLLHPSESLSCGRYRLNLQRRVLLNAQGSSLPLRPKSFDVLHFLLLRHGRVVSRRQILDAVWADIHVTEDSVTQCVLDIRRALRPDSCVVLRTIHRHGYALDATGAAAVEVTSPTLTLAVLPFQGVDASSSSRIGDGLAIDLLAELASYPGLHVIPCWGRGEGYDGLRSGRALQADWRLETTVTHDRGQLRIAAALISQTSGSLVWAKRWNFVIDGDDALKLRDMALRQMIDALAHPLGLAASLP